MADIEVRYSIEPRNFYLDEFLSFGKKIGTHATKVAKRMSNNNSQKLLDSAKKTTIDAIKNASKREATGDLTGNKIAHKITSNSKSPQNASKELHSKTSENEIEIPKERHISPEKRQEMMN